MEEYYFIVKSLVEESPKGSFALPIKWNVPAISKEISANGFIVQHVMQESDLIGLATNNYFEAWMVQNGVVEQGKIDYGYDDLWTVGECQFQWIKERNVGRKRTTVYRSEIYWIPKGTQEYLDVEKWDFGKVPQAVELRSATKCEVNFDISPFFVCNREYQHPWDLSDET